MSLCLKSVIVFSTVSPRKCKCVDLRNLVLVRQCGTVTMTIYPVHAHTRPLNISLRALPGLTFIYHHLDMFCRYKCHNIPFVSVSHQIRSEQVSYGHMGMSEKIMLFLVNRWTVCIVGYSSTLYKYTELAVVSLTNYTDHARPA